MHHPFKSTPLNRSAYSLPASSFVTLSMSSGRDSPRPSSTARRNSCLFLRHHDCYCSPTVMIQSGRGRLTESQVWSAVLFDRQGMACVCLAPERCIHEQMPWHCVHRPEDHRVLDPLPLISCSTICCRFCVYASPAEKEISACWRMKKTKNHMTFFSTTTMGRITSMP
jgi:hypothetical protein